MGSTYIKDTAMSEEYLMKRCLKCNSVTLQHVRTESTECLKCNTFTNSDADELFGEVKGE